MRVNITKIEWRKGTYLWRIILPIMGVFCLAILYIGLRKGDITACITILVFFGLPIWSGVYCLYRTPYHCIPASRFYDAKVLKRSIENEDFSVLESKTIWASEHWIRVKDYFFSKNLLFSIGGCVTNNRTLVLRTIDRKEYRVTSVGYITKERIRLIGNVLPYVKMLTERGFDGQSEIRSRDFLPEEYVDEWFNNYMKNHTVNDLILKTEALEAYANAYAKRCRI